jgi:hypothetical protein
VLGLPGGCLPSHAAFLRVPVEVTDGGPPPHEPAPGVAGETPLLVEIPLESLRAALPDFELAAAGFYYRGRDPLPFDLRDSDADRIKDVLRVVLPPPHDQEPWVIIVSPGVKARYGLDPDAVGRSRPARLDFSRAQR